MLKQEWAKNFSEVSQGDNTRDNGIIVVRRPLGTQELKYLPRALKI